MAPTIRYTERMSKLFIFFLIAGVGALIWTGILEINVKPEKVSNLPGSGISETTKSPLLEKARAFGVKGARKAELFFAENDDQKMEVILGFVEKDSKRLQEMMEVGRTAAEVKPQAQLLVESLRQARVQSWELSEGELADLSDNVQNVMNSALAVFHAIDTYYEDEAAEELAPVTAALTEELDTAIAQEKSEGAVAGTEDDARTEQDKEDSTTEESEPSTVPLRF